MHVVTDCPCGRQHEIQQAIGALYTHKTARMDSTLPITTPAGRFRVPRIWLACHGLDPGDIARAAIEHAFERVA
jgi:hypothetical protein